MASRLSLLNEVFTFVDGAGLGAGLAKHRKMASSPFVFFRGSAQLFYRDLAHEVIRADKDLYRLPKTMIVGDCHTSNFGFLSEEGSHGDSIVFSANDFDDACVGHAGWDLLRFSCSLALCALHCQAVVAGSIDTDKSYSGKPVISSSDVPTAIQAFLDSYLETCQCSLNQDNHYATAIESFSEDHILAKRHARALARAKGGETFAESSSLAKAADLSKSPPRFRSRSERHKPLDEAEYQRVYSVMSPYVDDAVVDIARRLNAGTGSVNMERYYLLVGPRQCDPDLDRGLYHIVEIKQQRKAAPLYYFDDLSPVNRLNPAHLTAVCQRRMQRRPDLVLDEVEFKGVHWLVRSRHHAKVGIDPEHIGIGKRAVKRGGFQQYAACCGRALALAHGRGDRRSTRFEEAALAWIPGLSESICESALSYADRVSADTDILRQLISH